MTELSPGWYEYGDGIVHSLICNSQIECMATEMSLNSCKLGIASKKYYKVQNYSLKHS